MRITSWEQNPDPVGQDIILDGLNPVEGVVDRQLLLSKILSFSEGKRFSRKIYEDDQGTIRYRYRQYLVRTTSSSKDSSGRFMTILVLIEIQEDDSVEGIRKELRKLSKYGLDDRYLSSISSHHRKKKSTTRRAAILIAALVTVTILCIIIGTIR